MKKVLFGCEQSTKLYRNISHIIFTYKMYQPYTFELTDKEAILTLFNCYRFRRHFARGTISADYRCLNTGAWKKDRIHYTKHLSCEFRRCPSILLYRRGYGLLNTVSCRVVGYIKQHIAKSQKPTEEMKRSNAFKVDKLVYQQLRFSPVFENTLNHEKRIQKWLWQYFFDKNIISMLIRLGYFGGMNIASYAYYQRHLSCFLRISHEYPNILPLLRYIKPKYWHDPNLFSYGYWVIQGGNSVIQQKLHTVLYSKIKLQIQNKSQWRWLKKQSFAVVARWDGHDLHRLIQHGIQDKIPVCLNQFLMSEKGDIWNGFGDTEKQIIIIRLFIRHGLEIWKNNGIRYLRHYLKEQARNEIRDCLDYWFDYWLLEGAEQGVPASWENLLTRTALWHNRIWEEEQRAYEVFDRKQSEKRQRLLDSHWSTSVEEYEIGEIQFKALTSGQALFDEGQKMHHCIFTYVQGCLNNTYRVFSVKEDCRAQTGKTRFTTLGLCFNEERQCWEIEQHRGAYNNPVSECVKKAGIHFCQVFNRS